MPSSARPPAPPGTELARLCRYYLDCLARDADEGVTIPLADGAAAKYAALPSMPLVSRDPENAIHDECALALLGRIARNQTSIGQLGYPVVLARGDRPAGHVGFYLEPIFLWPLDANGALKDEIPGINPAALRTLPSVGNGPALDEAIHLSHELGLGGGLADVPRFDELIQKLHQLRPDWPWRGIGRSGFTGP